MIQKKRVLAMIPARGGSKGIKNKNIIEVKGKPLIAYTIEAAKKSKYIDTVMVSTDSEAIKDVALQWGAAVPFMRPEELASDAAKTIDAVMHTVNFYREHADIYDYFVLLQPTSPLRSAEDIDGAIEKFLNCGERDLASISEVTDSPVLIRKIVDSTIMEKLLDVTSTVRRQEMPKYYRINGGIYITKIDKLSSEMSFNDSSVYYLMKKQHAIDIDEYVDLAVLEYYLG